MDSHFLLQCMKVKSGSEDAQSCPTLCDPIDCSLPGSSIHGVSQTRVLEWVAIAFSDIPCYHPLIEIRRRAQGQASVTWPSPCCLTLLPWLTQGGKFSSMEHVSFLGSSLRPGSLKGASCSDLSSPNLSHHQQGPCPWWDPLLSSQSA